MNDEQLREQLEHLNTELQDAESLDPGRRELLQGLAGNIQELLARSESEPDHYRTLGERLKEGVSELEASHPKITLLMRRAIDSLAYLGI
jgi:hypothetical protein